MAVSTATESGFRAVATAFPATGFAGRRSTGTTFARSLSVTHTLPRPGSPARPSAVPPSGRRARKRRRGRVS